MVEIERAQRPFWIHQIVEYMIGIALIAAAIQQLKPAVPAVMGLLIILNSAITIGPAGAFRIVSRRVHRYLDIVVLVILTVSVFQPWVEVEMIGRLLVGAITFVMFVVWFHTDFAERPDRKARREARAGQQSEEFGKQAGRMVGDTVNSLKRWKDSINDNDNDNDSDDT